jgi:hypothetical protein
MVLAAWMIIPKDDLPAASLKDFDFLGALFGVSGLILTSFAWNQAALVGWTTVYTYVLLIVGTLLLIVFVLVEIKVSKSPLVPIRGFKSDAALALGVIAAGWGSFGIWVFYLWRLIESLRVYSALALRTVSRCRHGLLIVPCPGALRPAALDIILLDRADSHCHSPGRPDLLGSDLCFDCHHALGHGHELSQCHDSAQQQYPKTRSRHRLITHQHHAQLQHISGTRYRWYYCQQRERVWR